MDPADSARREALSLLRLIAQLEWDLRFSVKLSYHSETAVLTALANAHAALGRILATLECRAQT
jgi:hypothetical protein